MTRAESLRCFVDDIRSILRLDPIYTALPRESRRRKAGSMRERPDVTFGVRGVALPGGNVWRVARTPRGG